MRIPGLDIDTDRIRLGMDNMRLTALLCSILDAVGPVTLTREQAEREWVGGRLKSEGHPDGSLTLSLEQSSSQLPEEQTGGAESELDSTTGAVGTDGGERVAPQ